jgi:hypothetical protein
MKLFFIGQKMEKCSYGGKTQPASFPPILHHHHHHHHPCLELIWPFNQTFAKIGRLLWLEAVPPNLAGTE